MMGSSVTIRPYEADKYVPRAENIPESLPFRAIYSKSFDPILLEAQRSCATISTAIADGISRDIEHRGTHALE